MKKIRKINTEDFFKFQNESCTNPWNGECGNTDIILYITYRGNRLPICHSCWNTIAEKDFEWSDDYAFS